MAIKVHGSVFSPAVLRVFACLNEKDLESEYVEINMRAGEHKKESFLALNPFGQVPGFEDGDLKLFESRAINQYIAQAYADKGNQQLTFVQDAKKMGPVYVWMEVEAQKFDPPSSKLVFELAVKPLLGMNTDDAVVAEHEGKLGEILDVYEARLGQSKYLAGDCFTLADLNHLPAINYLMGTTARKVFDARAHVSAWCADILARPSWAKVLALQKQHPI
ncbi:glutathione S-transferase-like [Coffea eugenioides]|uniref:glutathione S-transferase-like n=1 Tax=Coffea eugenioides TaxID=49369 RepID=UPI000F61103A|nr:glutathione S-transferase-like [Coffea eugenioides]